MPKIKIISCFLLCVFIIGLLCSCKALNYFDDGELSSYYEIIEEYDYGSNASRKSTTASGNDTSDGEDAIKRDMPSISEKTDVQIEKTVTTDSNIEEPELYDTINPIGTYDNHIAVPENDYCQYNSLSVGEKKLYDSIKSTVSKSNNIVDTSKLTFYENDVISVFQKFLADYPQYFYLSRSCILVYSPRMKNIRAVILMYTDGNTTDEFDENLHLVSFANRGLINKKTELLKARIRSIISTVPNTAADVVKEKIIHDYVVKTVTYDYDSAENISNFESTIPHAFDLYGAAIEKTAVCEGYSKLFQYLCLCVGINASQVTGTVNGGNHMWNSVLINGEWYQTDLTYDDGNKNISYSYFNLTTDAISENHIINTSELFVPQCSKTDFSFKNTFAVCISDINSQPKNYENAIENILSSGDNKIYIYFDKYNVANRPKYTRYIQRYILNVSSDFYKYLYNQGKYLSSSIKECNEYFVLTVR